MSAPDPDCQICQTATEQVLQVIQDSRDNGFSYKEVWRALDSDYSRNAVQKHVAHVPRGQPEKPIPKVVVKEPVQEVHVSQSEKPLRPRIHFVIPDTQAKSGVPDDHLGWIGQYLVDQFADEDVAVIHLGDHWDMPSLSSWDKGKRAMEGRRYIKDIEAGNDAFALLNRALNKENADRSASGRELWNPELHLLRGNHENRQVVATENDASLEGWMKDADFESPGWEVHPFLRIVDIDGVWYSHYFYVPMTGRPYSGTIDNRLKLIGHSFCMGHQQTLLYGMRYVGNRSQHALVAGACYLHEEDYKGPQANYHWRGIIVCHEVENGSYDPMFVSLDYLCRKYQGVKLEKFMGKNWSFA